MLNPGTTLGLYEIVSAIGSGGMGEVYQAHDTKLGRDVAIKVLPEAFAHDPQRLSRFQREAKLLASLNHPNIATIHGLEESSGTHYLVMELVPGETLAERVKREGPVPVEEALAIAKQIAEALEAAHEKSIIHRDLKPANVKVTPEGKVKVLDFGLAKAFAGEESGSDPSNSPTLSQAATLQGVILGTAAYMSPEQAAGKPVDKRADIWSFGVVLFEMLTGGRLFAGETVSHTLADVLRAPIDLDQLPKETPSAIRHLLRRCLDRDVKTRLRDIGEARVVISRVGKEPEAPAATAPLPSRLGYVAWGVAGLPLVALAALAFVHFRETPAEPHPVSRWTMPMGDTAAGGVVISRDGTRLAYAEGTDAASHLVLRILDQLEAKPVAGTERGVRPFFSPDGQWLAYFTGNGPLKKVPVTGGTPVTLCDAAMYFGGSWGEDDRIVFSSDSGLMRVSASGGACESLTKLDPQRGVYHRWPQILPGGQAVLFTIGEEGSFDSAQTAALDLKSRKYRVIASGGSRARYVPSGHIVYVRGGALFAVPFDLKRLAVTGGEVPVIEGVYYNSAGGFADYAFSDSGLLLYVAETRGATLSSLEWRDRKGAVQPLFATRQDYSYVRLSPDGLRAALSIGRQGANADVWILDLARSTLVRLTSDAVNSVPQWTPDGQRVAFASSGNHAINWTSTDGSGKPEMLLPEYGSPGSWTPDGKTLLYIYGSPSRIWALPVPGGKPQPLFETTAANLRQAQVSSDGRWVAYTSDETGKNQVYVGAFPGPGGKTPISIEGGQESRWSRDGRELFYRDPVKNQLMAVDVQTSPAFRAGQPKALFELSTSAWDVAPDSHRFLAVKPQEAAATAPQLHVVVNFFDELRRKLPPGTK